MNIMQSLLNKTSELESIHSLDRRTVVLIKTNLLDRDPRLSKEIDSLKQGGYSVILLCWDRDCASYFKEEKIDDKYREIRLKLKAPYGIKVLPFLLLWWCFEFYWLAKLRSDFIHAINFDTIFPAVVIGKIKKVSVIYEMFDTYEDEVILPRIIRNVLVNIDKIFMRVVKAVIIVDEARLEELKGIPNNNVIVIYNSPPDIFDNIKFPLEKQIREKFVVFYAGALYTARSPKLDNVFTAIKSIEGCEIIIAGYGDQVSEIETWANETPDKVQFIGKISYDEVLKRTLVADILIALYEPATLNIKHTSANKLFEAMMCRKPIVVSKDTGTADIVKKEKCGLIVDCNNIDQIRTAILRLKESPGLCYQLGANGRRTYEQKYNWEIMEQRLLSLYNKMNFKS